MRVQGYICRTPVGPAPMLLALCSLAAISASGWAQGSLLGGQTGGTARVGSKTRVLQGPSVFSSHPVTLRVNGNYETALDALFGQVPVNYVYALRAAPAAQATLDLKQTPFDGALNTVLHTYPAAPPVQQHLAGNVLSLMQNDPPGQPPNLNARLVTLRLKNVDIRDAFNALFAALGAEHAPVDNLTGRVTLSMRAAPHTRVLAALIKQSPRPLTLLERGNMLIIRRK